MRYPSSEFDEAVAKICHGTISDSALADLHELLRTDSEARDEYLWRVEVHGELASGRLDFHGSDATTKAESVATTPVTTRPRYMFARWPQYLPAFAASAVLIMCVLGASSWLLQDSPSPHAPFKEAVARFAELKDSRWMTSTTDFVSGDEVHKGQRIELSSGIVEAKFNSGTLLTMSGPAIIEPLSENSAFLLLGQVRVVTDTPGSKGFTLVTQTSKFVDMGTTFTATVAPDGLSCLDVTEGQVDVVIEGLEEVPRVRAGESLFVETGEQRVITRIESGDGTSVFKFPTISPPSSQDVADRSQGRATVRVVDGQLHMEAGGKSSISVLLDGAGQKRQDAPRESAFFESQTGSFLVDLGEDISITRINTYSWHQHSSITQHRNRARQRFTLYGFAGDGLPDLTLSPDETGWTRIARVNSDRFFDVREELDRPAQQACSISRPEGEIGRFRYLLWEVKGGTFYGEVDVFGTPASEADSVEQDQ